MASSTVEDYLKQLYLHEHASAQAEPVSTGRLAHAMGVTPGTATSMLKTLAGSGLVDYEARRGARLTAQGEALALHVLRRHRLMELFLVQVLGLDWSVVNEEAELLEHAVSDRVIEAIDVLLGRPTADPHGDPIPGRGGHIEGAGDRSLATCVVGLEVEISRILNQDPDFLRFLDGAGLTPGARVRVERRDAAADAVTVRAGSGAPVSMGAGAAGKILVRENEPSPGART